MYISSSNLTSILFFSTIFYSYNILISLVFVLHLSVILPIFWIFYSYRVYEIYSARRWSQAAVASLQLMHRCGKTNEHLPTRSTFMAKRQPLAPDASPDGPPERADMNTWGHVDSTRPNGVFNLCVAYVTSKVEKETRLDWQSPGTHMSTSSSFGRSRT